MSRIYYCILFALTLTGLHAGTSHAQDEAGKKEAAAVKIELASGKLHMVAPKDWKSKKPKFPQMTPYEFTVPADAKEGEPTARVTFTAAGGSIKDNIARWQGQFEKLDEAKSKKDEFEAAKQKVYWVDFQGSFKDTMGAPPMMRVKPTIRDDYRMLGAIIETQGMGKYFIKVTGPAKVVEGIEEPMKKMLKELTVK